MQAALPLFIADGAQSQGQQFLRLQYGINIADITLRILKGSIQQQYCGMDPFYSPSGSLQTSTQPSAPAAASSSCKVSLTAVWPLPAAITAPIRAPQVLSKQQPVLPVLRCSFYSPLSLMNRSIFDIIIKFL